jgi:uncharacterized membrane protein YbjE (DUF340 family)
MFLGIIVGLLLRKKIVLLQTLDKSVNYVIWVLLLLLGISIGVNKTIVNNLGTLGAQSLLLTFFIVSGSLLSSVIVFKYFFNK